jgi:hypothetical protein
MNYSSLHLDQDEHVILEVRKHWIVFLSDVLAFIMGAILPLCIFVAAKIFFPSVLQKIIPFIVLPGNVYALILFFYILWILFLWLTFFIEWTKYYLDVWYVTEKRIIGIKQDKIFSREISNLRFDKIQDVTIDVRGFISTVLHFGNIKVQTAGEDNYDFRMSTVRNPDEVRKVIFNKHNEIGDSSFKTKSTP